MMTTEWWSYLYTVGAAQGVLLSVALWGRAGRGHSSRILAVWIAVLSAHLAVLVLHLRAPLADPVVLRAYGLTRFLPFIYAGFFYVYVHALIHHRKHRWSDWIHAAPLVVILVINAELLRLPVDALRALFTSGRLPQGMDAWRFALIDPLLFVCSAAYLTAAIRLILRFRRRLEQERADADRQGLHWLLVMAAWQLAIWVVALTQAVVSIPGINHWTIYGIVSAWVFVLGYMSLSRPAPLDLATPDADSQAGGQHNSEAVSGEAVRGEPVDAPLNEHQYADVLQRTDALMQHDELFRQPALTIAVLAKRSGYPQYLVSAAINRERGGNFYEYVNSWRVAAAKRLIDEDHKHKLIDIGYAVGFTAKSTFNQAFKRYAGMTPSAYRKAGAAATHTPPG